MTAMLNRIILKEMGYVGPHARCNADGWPTGDLSQSPPFSRDDPVIALAALPPAADTAGDRAGVDDEEVPAGALAADQAAK
jgi:hypothetical protein